ncbi:ABC transporter permease [Erysipelothrix sp. HDW6C]|uniref:permease-like cell division protein FtsX n=1 Tax=Erysipelothrix sp. HDW6C TaxID=2714930 RepID=UPI00140C4122|nr:permease-like cell division protein FtsX [Erysipelothrix sp. HDW6C]QIK68883.1 ABC transporter permease [Erysipelothrix sp. HDW6C]
MSRVLRHFKEGFLGVVRHFALSLSSISSVTVTLLIMALFLLLSANIMQITEQMESNVQIHVQVKKEFEGQEKTDKIEAAIRALPHVTSVTFSSKADELEAYIALNDADDAEQMFGSFRGENNPMLDAFLVSADTGENLKTVSAAIATIEGVEKSTYGGDATSQFVSGLEQIRNVGFFIVAALGVIAVFLISNTIRVSIHSRRREISIMRTVGATNWYIRWPFIIEGMIIGLLGALIPILVTIFGYKYLFDSTGGYLYSKMFSLVAVTPLVYQISGVLALIGAVVGSIGSLLSVGKFLRWTR